MRSIISATMLAHTILYVSSFGTADKRSDTPHDTMSSTPFSCMFFLATLTATESRSHAKQRAAPSFAAHIDKIPLPHPMSRTKSPGFT